MASKGQVESLTEEAICPICLDFFTDPVILECGHNFCRSCITRCWERKGGNSCPECREVFADRILRVNRALANLSEKARKLNLNPKEKENKLHCEKHEEELKLFCETDKTLICLICRDSREHKSHDFLPINEAVEVYRDRVKSSLDSLTKRKSDFEKVEQEQKEKISGVRGQSHSLQSQITSHFAELHQILTEREQCTLKDLREEEERILNLMEKNLREIQEHLHSVREEISKLQEWVDQKDSVIFLMDEARRKRRISDDTQTMSVTDGALLVEKFYHPYLFNTAFGDKFDGIKRVSVTLDVETTHPWLEVSEDRKSVRYTGKWRNLRDTRKRFTVGLCVLGSEGFTSGRHYWEVEVAGNWGWGLGVAADSVDRKRAVGTTPETGIWIIGRDDDVFNTNVTKLRFSPESRLPAGPIPGRVGIYLSYESGTVSFYNAETKSHLRTFTGNKFTGKLYPLLWIWDKSQWLRICSGSTPDLQSQGSPAISLHYTQCAGGAQQKSSLSDARSYCQSPQGGDDGPFDNNGDQRRRCREVSEYDYFLGWVTGILWFFAPQDAGVQQIPKSKRIVTHEVLGFNMALKGQVESLTEEAICSICLDFFTDPVSLDCGHDFCRSCIRRCWKREERNTWPECREEFIDRTLRVNWALARLAEKARKVNPNPREKKNKLHCEEHQEELKLFCETDKKLICVICRDAREHKYHNFMLVKEAVEIYKEEDCRKKRSVADGTLLVEKFDQPLLHTVWRDMFHVTKLISVTLDVETANPWLEVSEDRKSVRWTRTRRDLPDNGKRFTVWFCVLGSEGFTSGRHYWEVEVTGNQRWILRVAAESVERKGGIALSPETGFWTVQRLCNEFHVLTSPPYRLAAGPIHRETLSFFLDLGWKPVAENLQFLSWAIKGWGPGASVRSTSSGFHIGLISHISLQWKRVMLNSGRQMQKQMGQLLQLFALRLFFHLPGRNVSQLPTVQQEMWRITLVNSPRLDTRERASQTEGITKTGNMVLQQLSGKRSTTITDTDGIDRARLVDNRGTAGVQQLLETERTLNQEVPGMASKGQVESWTDEAICPICLDFFTDPVSLECGHNFCRSCITRHWKREERNTCPECRAQFADRILRPCWLLARLTEKARKVQLKSRQKKRKPHCKKHEEELKLFCETDKKLICVICRDAREHKEHRFLPIKEAFEVYKDQVKSSFELLTKRKSVIKAMAELQKQNIERVREQSHSLQSDITSQFAELHQILTEKEQHLLRDLRKEEARIRNPMEKNLRVIQEKLNSIREEISMLQKQLDEKDSVKFLKEEAQQKKRICDEEVSLSVTDGALPIAKFNCLFLLKNILGESFDAINRVSVTLDVETAHPELEVSEDRKSVRRTGTRRNLPDTGKRFTHWFCVLGSEGFTSGRHYWEVEVTGNRYWGLEIAAESVERKRQVRLIPETGFWTIRRDDLVMRVLTSPESRLPAGPIPGRVGVYLNYESGTVSFYNAETKSHLHTFTGSKFTGKLCPFFWTGYTNQWLRICSGSAPGL
ncbi:uncharacterized protein [Mobula birostris]|uniref:uncharacterized protein n=1 Tax=Mobula birostris TaxID=1983395 RepID=UPI003B280BDB